MPRKVPEYLVDEAAIVATHDGMIIQDHDLSTHVALINASLECLSGLPEFHKEKSDEDLTILRLAIRSFNSGAAALRLVRCGYFQPALTMVRDLIEIYFLLDLFSREASSLSEWLSMSEKERSKNFKPVRVRERLDVLDGFKGQRRAETYKLFSENAAHVNPYGYHIISPNNLTRIGPFSDEGRLRAVLEELAMHLAYGAVIVCNAVNTEAPEILAVKERFLHHFGVWQHEYLSQKSQAPK
ncbi:hypothetical protein [Rhizobium sp. 768_B6_N1_8]|uniref:hypothetical protein n=1 Tax=unclassified Rhizobium TaxID=2613769 RepID=UPI003F23B1F0